MLGIFVEFYNLVNHAFAEYKFGFIKSERRKLDSGNNSYYKSERHTDGCNYNICFFIVHIRLDFSHCRFEFRIFFHFARLLLQH